LWMRFQPGLTVRSDNPVFEQDVSRFWDHLLPIVVKDQISRGGNVIMVQLENEHPKGWGTDGLSDPYFQFLQKKAVDAGLEVPYFFSGLHHGSEPGGAGPGSNAGRTNPWFSTEFWCDWYNDFDYFNDDEDASSYDYGAAVGEGGDLRPEYYKFKRAAWFARSFQDILENDNGAESRADVVSNAAIKVSERHGPAGAIYFLNNPGSQSQQTTITLNGAAYPQSAPLTVNAGEFVPVVTGYQMVDGVTLDVAPVRILGITQQGDTTTLVIYGQPGTPAELYFTVPTGAVVQAGGSGLTLDASGHMTLKSVFSAGAPSNYSFKIGSRRVRILAVSDALADKTWFVGSGVQSYVVTGPPYVGSALTENGALRVAAESPWAAASSDKVAAYGAGDTPMSMPRISTQPVHPAGPHLAAWQTLSGIVEAAPGFDASGWISSNSGPQQMGADGDVSSYAWYRSTVAASSTAPYVVSIENVGDRMVPYVDGVRVASGDVKIASFKVNLTAGSHTIAIFTAHYGRNKFFNYLGPIDRAYAKGLVGQVSLQQMADNATPITSWKMMPATGDAFNSPLPQADAAGWKDYTVGADAFAGQTGYAWFQTTLPVMPPSMVEATLSFSSLDDNSWVYLNGKRLASHEGWNVPFQVNAGGAWNPAGPNVLTLLIQNTGGTGGIDSQITLAPLKSSTGLMDWRMHGGPGNPDVVSGWHALAREASGDPSFYKTTFSVPSGLSSPVWRVVTTGLTHGSVWVNGHNLGRYPQTTPAPGVYIPECWLTPGKNTLVIFDENGALPNGVQIQPEAAASRDVIKYQSGLKQ